MNNFDDDDSGAYYGGCCVHGESTISMLNGSTKQVKDLKKGDMIATPGNNTGASVVCLVKTKTW